MRFLINVKFTKNTLLHFFFLFRLFLMQARIQNFIINFQFHGIFLSNAGYPSIYPLIISQILLPLLYTLFFLFYIFQVQFQQIMNSFFH